MSGAVQRPPGARSFLQLEGPDSTLLSGPEGIVGFPIRHSNARKFRTIWQGHPSNLLF